MRGDTHGGIETTPGLDRCEGSILSGWLCRGAGFAERRITTKPRSATFVLPFSNAELLVEVGDVTGAANSPDPSRHTPQNRNPGPRAQAPMRALPV